MKERSRPWIFAFLSEKFFAPCAVHECSKKSEKNIFCIDCCQAICSHCLNFHRSHLLLQVRRYVYHDVVRLDDMEKLFNCTFVQTRPLKGSSTHSACNTCDRALQEPYQFCSLACKVQYVVAYEGCVSRYLYDCDYLQLSTSDMGYAGFEADEDGGDMTQSSVVLDDASTGMVVCSSYSSSSSSSGTQSNSNDNNGQLIERFLTVGCSATTDNVVRKKRSTVSNRPNASSTKICSQNAPRHVGKRKGFPLRSPLY
ncbi:hypothetical protein Sjap_010412 [Stephania japonica]|uniref:B box-type domain-containing protein n=1 Tax=Stephania japonica TaxID=461633 RepID=A0AAP0P6D7_9MAGN